MHGVKRLFGWMIPRFDSDRFRVSLVSLRKKDLSEETLDTLGVDKPETKCKAYTQ